MKLCFLATKPEIGRYQIAFRPRLGPCTYSLKQAYIAYIYFVWFVDSEDLKAYCHPGTSYGHTKLISLSCLRSFYVKVQSTLAHDSVQFTVKVGLIEKKLNACVNIFRERVKLILYGHRKFEGDSVPLNISANLTLCWQISSTHAFL